LNESQLRIGALLRRKKRMTLNAGKEYFYVWFKKMAIY
jgi:hypothetical protein